MEFCHCNPAVQSESMDDPNECGNCGRLFQQEDKEGMMSKFTGDIGPEEEDGLGWEGLLPDKEDECQRCGTYPCACGLPPKPNDSTITLPADDGMKLCHFRQAVERMLTCQEGVGVVREKLAEAAKIKLGGE